MILRVGFICRSCLSRTRQLRQVQTHAQRPPPWIQPPQLLRRTFSRHARLYSTDPTVHDRQLKRLDSLTKFLEEPKHMEEEFKKEYDESLGKTLGHEIYNNTYNPEVSLDDLLPARNENTDSDTLHWFDPDPDRNKRWRRRMRVPKFMWSPKGYPERNKILAYTLKDVTHRQDRRRIERHLSLWRFDFAVTWQRIKPRQPNERPLAPLVRVRFLDNRVRRILEHDDHAKILLAWIETMDLTAGNTVERDWRLVMIAILRFYPEKGIDFCQATFDEHVTPHYAVRDILGFLVTWAHRVIENETPESQRIREATRAALPDFVMHILRHSSPNFVQFHQWALYNVFRTSDAEKLCELFDELERYKHPLHPYTRFQIAGRLAKDVRFKTKALEILEGIVTAGDVHPETPHCMALACAIIHFPKPDFENTMLGQLRTELTERLLRIITPNLYCYSVMIRSQCLNNNLEAALQIYELMVEHEVQPDRVVYTILLDGAKRSGSISNICRVLQHIPTRYWSDGRLVRELVHTVVLYNRHKWAVIDIFAGALAIYSQFYTLKSLQRLLPYDLGPIIAGATRFSDSVHQQTWQEELRQILELLPEVEQKKEDDIGLLAIMLIAYIRNSHGQYNMMVCHNHFRSLLARGDPLACEIVREKGTVIHDASIKNLMRDRTGMRVALDILGDMLDGDRARKAAAAVVQGGVTRVTTQNSPWPTKEAEAQQRAAWKETGKPHQSLHPPPSVYTWTHLIHGAMKHKKYAQGENFLRMMSQHGTKPNAVTYNALLSGYGKAQQVDRMVQMVDQMDNEGHGIDDWTIKAFSKLKNKERAFAMLEKMLEEKAQQNITASEEEDLLDLPDVDKLSSQLMPDEEAAKIEDAEGDWAELEALFYQPPKIPPEKMKPTF